MKFNIGDIVNADGTEYHIAGRITYKNTSDGMYWDEYRMIPVSGGAEAWLSVDEIYDEYSISKKASVMTSTAGYHLVDQGTEVVTSCEGSVDVSYGDRARFYEYEDSTEEKIISREVWDDETEVCTGYYLDKDEFYFVRHDTEYKAPGAGSAGLTLIVLAIVALFILLPDLIGSIHFTPTIRKTLDKNSSFTYVTSITGEDKQKARVYSVGSYYTVGDAAKWIIDGIEGETEVVQQDDEDPENGSIGILTKKEYCLVYKGEDGEVLAQVSNRKYAYTTDNTPYHGTSRAHRYYRRFYYSGGYDSDSRKYKSSSSPYSSYDGDSMSFSSSDTYSSYSSSVRQASIYSRSSSGGGLSSGK